VSPPALPACLPACLPARPPTQFVWDSSGQVVLLGEGSQALVCLGRLQGMEVAVKVGRAGGQGQGQERLFGGQTRERASYKATLDSVMPNRWFVKLAQLAHAHPTAHPPHLPQACELQPGVDPQAVLREAALLRHCAHPRIVPLFAVACQVCRCKGDDAPSCGGDGGGTEGFVRVMCVRRSSASLLQRRVLSVSCN